MAINPDCDVCHGTGSDSYEYCGVSHGVRCPKCFPERHCPECAAIWYSPTNHQKWCSRMGTVAPKEP